MKWWYMFGGGARWQLLYEDQVQTFYTLGGLSNPAWAELQSETHSSVEKNIFFFHELYLEQRSKCLLRLKSELNFLRGV